MVKEPLGNLVYSVHHHSPQRLLTNDYYEFRRLNPSLNEKLILSILSDRECVNLLLVEETGLFP